MERRTPDGSHSHARTTRVKDQKEESEESAKKGGKHALDALLAGVTPENVHGEFDTGPAVGQESW
jgi:antitoxin component of MazEF toxin-antitoxin module